MDAMNYAFKDYGVLQKDSITLASFLAGNGHLRLQKFAAFFSRVLTTRHRKRCNIFWKMGFTAECRKIYNLFKKFKNRIRIGRPQDANTSKAALLGAPKPLILGKPRPLYFENQIQKFKIYYPHQMWFFSMFLCKQRI